MGALDDASAFLGILSSFFRELLHFPFLLSLLSAHLRVFDLPCASVPLPHWWGFNKATAVLGHVCVLDVRPVLIT